MAMTEDPLKGCVNIYDRDFYNGFVKTEVPRNVQNIVDGWKRPAGSHEEFYPPLELFKQGWKAVLTAYYNLGFAISKMEEKGLDLTSRDMVVCCRCFGVPNQVWKTCWILQNMEGQD